MFMKEPEIFTWDLVESREVWTIRSRFACLGTSILPTVLDTFQPNMICLALKYPIRLLFGFVLCSINPDLMCFRVYCNMHIELGVFYSPLHK